MFVDIEIGNEKILVSFKLNTGAQVDVIPYMCSTYLSVII